MAQEKNRFQVMLDEEARREYLRDTDAQAAEWAKLKYRQPDVPDPEHPAPRRDAPTDHDRLAQRATHRSVVERVRAQHQPGAPPPVLRAPYQPPALAIPPPPLAIRRAPWWRRLWGEVREAWRRLP